MHTLAYIGFDLAVSTPRDTSAYIAMTFMARIHRDTSFQSRFGRQRCISMYLTLPCGYIDFDSAVSTHRHTSAYIDSDFDSQGYISIHRHDVYGEDTSGYIVSKSFRPSAMYLDVSHITMRIH
jgi:hypothetical protein